MRRIAALILLLFAVGILAGAAAAQPTRPVVDVAEVFGVLDDQLATFVLDRIDEANNDGAALLVLQLDTAGAIEVDVRTILDRMASSKVPIAVWVGPRAAKARSAGAFIVTAAHVAAIGPSGRLGPLHPAELSVDPDTAAGGRLRDDEETLARALAQARGRSDPSPYFDASLGANASLDAGAVDVITPSVAELLQRSDGRTVTTAAGAVTLRLRTDEVAIRLLKPGPIKAFLHTLASPPLVYLMLLTAAMLVAFEAFQPGFGVAGITGVLLLAGVVYGLTVLPVSIVGIVAFSAGIGLLGLDVAIHGLGVPTFAGTGLLAYGSLTMFPAPAGALGIPGWLVALGVVSALVFFVPVMTLVRRSRLKPEEQREARALVGQPGRVRSVLNPEGFVWVADGLWRARSEDGSRVRVGENVVVASVDGSLLRVRRP